MEVKVIKSIIEVPENVRKQAEGAFMLGLKVELCGEWLWVAAPKKHAEDMKKMGFRWSPNKAKWYFSPKPIKRAAYYHPWTMDEIRKAHGSAMVEDGGKVA